MLGKSLYLMLPEGKPPFIGVFLAYSVPFNTEAQHWVDFPKDCDLLLEIGKERTELRILERGFERNYVHRDLEYNPLDLQNWLKAVGGAKKLNFGIVVERAGKIKIDRTFKTNKPFYFEVKRLLIVNADNINASAVVYFGEPAQTESDPILKVVRD